MTISPDALSVTVAVPSCIRLSRLSSRAPCPWGEVRTSRWRTRGGLGLGAGCADVCGWGGAAQLDSRTIAPASSRRFMAARIVDEVGALELLESIVVDVGGVHTAPDPGDRGPGREEGRRRRRDPPPRGRAGRRAH